MSISAQNTPIPVIISFSHTVDPFATRRNASTVGGMIRSLRDSISARYETVRSRNWEFWPTDRVELFWINQTIAMTATRGIIEHLALDPGIAVIEEDDATFVQVLPLTSASELSDAFAVPWNISLTGIDSVWTAYGLDGQGIVIGSLDTGIDPTHPALGGKLRADNAWKDFIFGQTSPYDNLGHGTFSSGILVGGEGANGAGPGIGIAFHSRLIVGKMLDAGSTPISVVTAAMQWMLDPDGNPETDDFPHVVNNSWYSGTRGSTYAYAAASAWRAAGIIPVFCAGNSGPAPASSRSPGDYKNSISVGGTDSNDDRYDNTSVGPSPSDTNYFPADGRKPDFSAPGEVVTSSQKGGGYAVSSGTSWSAPHVSGIIALMLQANPTLTYDEVYSIIKASAVDLGAGGYDYVFGYGRISAMGAIKGALSARVAVEGDPVLNTTEGGQSSHFDLSLKVWPRDTVWLSLSSTDTSEGTISPNLIRFTSIDYDLPHRVTVTGRDDDLWDGDATYLITMSTTSNDPLYDGLEPPPVTAVNADDEIVYGVRVNLRSGWNLVSVPTIMSNASRNSVYPTSVSPAYAYDREDSGYVIGDTLRRGVGYWLKFGSDQFVDLVGDTTAIETVSVYRGWNLIGSLTAPVAVEGIVSAPPNINTSAFFGYGAGYMATDTIMPGLGYWVKVESDGKLILMIDAASGTAGTIQIIGRAGPPGPGP